MQNALVFLQQLNASDYVFVSFAGAVKLAMYWDDLVITPRVTYVTICNLVVLVNDILSLIQSGNVKYVLLSEYISICSDLARPFWHGARHARFYIRQAAPFYQLEAPCRFWPNTAIFCLHSAGISATCIQDTL